MMLMYTKPYRQQPNERIGHVADTENDGVSKELSLLCFKRPEKRGERPINLNTLILLPQIGKLLFNPMGFLVITLRSSVQAIHGSLVSKVLCWCCESTCYLKILNYDILNSTGANHGIHFDSRIHGSPHELSCSMSVSSESFRSKLRNSMVV